MGKSVNKVILIGNCGKDPEIRATAAGMTIANFSIATAERIKGSNGEWTEKTEWHNIVAFQRTAEIIRDYVKKGSKVYIEGRLQTSSWDDNTSGKKRYKTEIVVNDLSLLSGRGEGNGNGNSNSNSNGAGSSYQDSSMRGYAPSNANGQGYADHGITDDDLPF